MRKVRTASGAVAVQIITRASGVVLSIEHVGSAHDDAELSLLLLAAEERLSPGQEAFELGDLPRVAASVTRIADWTEPKALKVPASRGRPPVVAGGGRLIGTSSVLLWETLKDAYSRLGFEELGDDAFRAMVLARLIEPTSKADTLRVLSEIGAPTPSLRTLFRSLERCGRREYRDQIARACLAYSTRASGLAALVMYDVTTLHFERDDEDQLRKVGMSKERRADPQVQVGLLVDPAGFPLEVHLFEGNKAETKTIVPVLEAFQARHGVTDLVVVADAGMLCAANLNALEDAGFSFIVGSRLTKAPYDLADHFASKGDAFTDGQILESTRVMDFKGDGRERRIVDQWLFKRHKRDDRNINLMIERAERIAAGKSAARQARFLKVTGGTTSLNETTIARARQLAGLKGYVTNLPATALSGEAVIAAYHDLWQVEASFRMTKNDLRARPVFHHQRDAIEAHLTVVFAALAVSRYLTTTTGQSLKKIIRTLRAVHTATIEVNGQRLTLDQAPNDTANAILTALETGH